MSLRDAVARHVPDGASVVLGAANPLDGSPLLLIPAITPDVTVLVVHRADEDGNAQLWGPWACRRIRGYDPAGFWTRRGE